MSSLVITRKVGTYELSVQCQPDELRAGLRMLEESAKELNGLMNDPEFGPFMEIPTIAGANNMTEKISMLYQGDWGNRPRTIREIAEALKANNTFVPITTLSSVLFNMIEKGKLKRMKIDKHWAYHRGRLA